MDACILTHDNTCIHFSVIFQMGGNSDFKVDETLGKPVPSAVVHVSNQ